MACSVVLAVVVYMFLQFDHVIHCLNLYFKKCMFQNIIFVLRSCFIPRHYKVPHFRAVIVILQYQPVPTWIIYWCVKMSHSPANSLMYIRANRVMKPQSEHHLNKMEMLPCDHQTAKFWELNRTVLTIKNRRRGRVQSNQSDVHIQCAWLNTNRETRPPNILKLKGSQQAL